MNKMFFVVLLVVLFNLTASADIGYYWRTFDGVIQVDSIIGGQNKNGDLMYVVEGYVPNEGIIIGYITSASTDVYVQVNGVKPAKASKVLCGYEQNFSWIPTQYGQLENDLQGKNPVIGGYQDERGHLYVARRIANGQTYIGKVIPTGTYSQIFLAVDENLESVEEYDYEILVYAQ